MYVGKPLKPASLIHTRTVDVSADEFNSKCNCQCQAKMRFATAVRVISISISLLGQQKVAVGCDGDCSNYCWGPLEILGACDCCPEAASIFRSPVLSIPQQQTIVLSEGTVITAGLDNQAAVGATGDDVNLIVNGGNYSSMAGTGMIFGIQANVTMCGGMIYGGSMLNDYENKTTPFAGMLVHSGATLHMAGGSIKGGDGNEIESSDDHGPALIVHTDVAGLSTTAAIITAGTITAGKNPNGTSYSLGVLQGAQVVVSGGTFSGDWFVAGDLTVYTKKHHFMNKDGKVSAVLCDGSYLDNVYILEDGEGSVTWIAESCEQAPKVSGCDVGGSRKGKGGKESSNGKGKGKGKESVFD